ncbi:MFS transporter [Elioraea sp.]|uniref:MFS transporter n=1 Tax=Elioraea sp. TaxID=2185103 RepID=UPI003F6F851A
MSSLSTEKPGPSVVTVLLALLAVHLAGMGAFLAVPVLAPLIGASAGLPPSLAGLHTSIVYAGTLVSGPLTGALILRYGAVRLLQVSLVVIAFGLALATIGPAWALALSALVCGVGHGPLTPAGSQVLHARAPARRRSLIFGLKQTGVPAGAAMIGVSAPLLAVTIGWRGAILAVVVFGMAVAAGLQPLRREMDRDADPAQRISWRGALDSIRLFRTAPPLRAITIAASSFGIGQFCFSSFFVVFQVEALGYDLVAAGVNLALAQLAGVVGRVGWGVVADRLAPAPVLRFLGAAIAASSMTLAVATPAWPPTAVAAAGIAMGATAIGWNGVLLGEAARLAPAGQAGAATAMLGVVFALVMLAAPSAFSLLVQATGGYAAGFGLCAAAGIVGALVLGPMARASFTRS